MKAYVIIEHDIESSTVHAVTLDKAVADEIERIDASLSAEEWDLSDGVPVRTVVYIVSGDPATGERPKVTGSACWPWDYFLTRTVEPDVVDRRAGGALFSPAMEARMINRFLGLPEREAPPLPPFVVRCQDLRKAIAVYDAEIVRLMDRG